MSTPSWINRDRPAGDHPTDGQPAGRNGWDEVRHAGVGSRAELDQLDQRDDEPGDQPAGPGPGTRRDVVLDKRTHRAGEDLDDAQAGRRGTGLGSFRGPRFVHERVDSLRDLLVAARTATYTGCHLRVVRAGNEAFYWLVTVPVLTVVFPLIWTFALSLHRALTAWFLIVVVAPFVNPHVDWLVLDGLDVSTWSFTTRAVVGTGALVFLATTAIAAVAERRREARAITAENERLLTAAGERWR
jgi:hypothetical protein